MPGDESTIMLQKDAILLKSVAVLSIKYHDTPSTKNNQNKLLANILNS